MSAQPEARQNDLTLGGGLLILGALLVPGTFMMAREAYLNAYGRYSLNIHTAPTLALACALSFYGICAWEVLGVILLGVATVRRKAVHVSEVVALILGAALVSVTLFLAR
jgi:hypothetical protein